MCYIQNHVITTVLYRGWSVIKKIFQHISATIFTRNSMVSIKLFVFYSELEFWLNEIITSQLTFLQYIDAPTLHHNTGVLVAELS